MHLRVQSRVAYYTARFKQAAKFSKFGILETCKMCRSIKKYSARAHESTVQINGRLTEDGHIVAISEIFRKHLNPRRFERIHKQCGYFEKFYSLLENCCIILDI
jgi:hypothetical protein